ncbi:erythromycin esterase family protein [Nocardia gipuzkoensis]
MTTNTSAEAIKLSDEAVRPLRTLDPAAPLDDLSWLDDVIGDARVVALGESAHYNHEFHLLRHRLLRYLVERHGFNAYTMPSGFSEGWLVDDWVRGGEGHLDTVIAAGTTSLMASWSEVRAQLEWMRQHNRGATRPVGFYGVDLSGSTVSLLPSLDAVTAYFAQADPEFEVDASIRETAAIFSAPSAFSLNEAVTAYKELYPAKRDALTAGLAGLVTRLTGRRLDYLTRTSSEAYERALRSLHLTVALDAIPRAILRGDRQEIMFLRDAAMADTVEWVLRREDRIVLAGHNGNLLRHPLALPDMPPATPLGMHLVDRLGADYRVIGTTFGTGQTVNPDNDFYTGNLFIELQPPRPGSFDALLNASHDGPFAVDLRRMSERDRTIIRSTSQQRTGNMYLDVNPLEAFDAIIHIPYVTAAEPDTASLAESPEDVQKAFAQWMNR